MTSQYARPNDARLAWTGESTADYSARTLPRPIMPKSFLGRVWEWLNRPMW